MIRSIVVEAEDRPPDEETLRAFYDEEQGFFTQPGRLRVSQLFFRVPDAEREDEVRARAADAAARWRAGEDEAVLRERLADEEGLPRSGHAAPPGEAARVHRADRAPQCDGPRGRRGR